MGYWSLLSQLEVTSLSVYTEKQLYPLTLIYTDFAASKNVASESEIRTPNPTPHMLCVSPILSLEAQEQAGEIFY